MSSSRLGISFGGVADLLEEDESSLDAVEWAQRKVGTHLWSKQREIAQSVEQYRKTAVQAGHGIGKAEPLTEPVATPSGWSTIGQLVPGDAVFDENGAICRVVACSPVWFGDTYRVEFSDGVAVDTHAHHEWDVLEVNRRTPAQKRGVRDWRDHWLATRRMSSHELARQGVRSASGQCRWRIPTARALQLPEAVLPIDPYVLGVWLGDGTTNQGVLTLNHSDADEILDRVGQHHEVPSTYRQGSCGYRVDGLQTALREAGLLGNKHIPMRYLRASESQRWELLRGLMDTDGYRRKGGDDEITLTDKQLAQDFYDLVVSLGVSVRTSESDAVLYGRVVGRRWRIGARFPHCPYYVSRYGNEWSEPARQASRFTQRTITAVYPVDPVPTRCIQVDSPSHRYLTGRGLVPTHNSLLASTIASWWVDSHPVGEAFVITTAPSTPQVHAILWEEIRSIHHKARLPGEAQLSDNWIIGRTLVGMGRKPQDYNDHAFQGIHRRYVLAIIDEACGVAPNLWTAIDTITTGENCRILAIGNPDDPGSHFAKVCTRDSTWNTIRISVLESPNFTGEVDQMPREARELLTTPEWVEDKRRSWGEDSALWTSKILGRFPETDEFALIPLSWVEQSHTRWREHQAAGTLESAHSDGAVVREDGRGGTGGAVWGIDVARYGKDKTTIAGRRGNVIVDVEAFSGLDTEAVAQRVRARADQYDDMCVIDVVGIGAGVFDALSREDASNGGLPYHATAFNAAEKTDRSDTTGELRFTDSRSAGWWLLREALDPSQGATLALPPIEELTIDLTTPRWENKPGGKIKVETKREIQKRSGRSTDYADAVMQSLWVSEIAPEPDIPASYYWDDDHEDSDESDLASYGLDWTTDVNDVPDPSTW